MDNHHHTFLWSAIAAIVIIAGLIFYSVHSMYPPSPQPKGAPPETFSAHRAIEHAFACSTETHPAGSKNNDAVAEYFFNELQKLGLEVEFMSKSDWVYDSLQRQQAVIGRIPGTDNTGAVAFSAHYDSFPYGPGATDDIGGCIVMLETARAFMNRPRMRNDLLFLFLDAEEIGGYGARGFCSHPLAKNIGIVTNLDVRGTKGPALVYETSSGNSALISELRKAKVHGLMPVANSLMFAIYDRSPFGSDFTKFRNAGMKGYNIAYIENFMWYHTVNDKPEHIHPPSIQHMGAYAMGLARHFGDVDFRKMELETRNDVYFNTLGFRMVQYPKSWGTPLAVLAVLLLFAIVLAGLVAKRLTVGGLLLSLLIVPGATLLAALASLLLLAVVFGYENTIYLYTVKFTYIPEPRALYYGALYCYAFAAAAVATAGLVFSFASRWMRIANLYAAGLLWLCPVLTGLVLLFPGGSYLLAWPVFFGALGLAWLYTGKRGEEPGPLRLLAATLFAIPAICLISPGWQMLQWMLMILAAPALAAVAVLIMLNVMPALALVGRTPRMWGVYPAMACLAILLVTTGMFLSRPSAECPQMNSVAYFADLDEGVAWWLSEDASVDRWTQQFFPSAERHAIDDLLPQKRGEHYLRAEAPVAGHLSGLIHEEIIDAVMGNVRHITLRLHTNDYPFEVRIRQTQGPPVNAITIDGQDVPLREGPFAFTFQMFPQQGYEFAFETTPDASVAFEALTSSYGQPDIPGVAPRPEYMAPEPNTLRNGIALRGERMYIRNKIIGLSA